MATQSDDLYTSLMQHYTLLENSKVECKICKRQICMVNWNSLIVHSSNHKTIETSYKARSHNSIWQYFSKFEGCAKCVICGSIVSAAYRLIYHLERKHPEIANLINAHKHTIKKITKHDSYCRYLSKFKVQCKLCNKIFDPNNVSRHLKRIHPQYSHNIMSKKKIRNWIWQYVKIESYDKISCNICDRPYILSSGSTRNIKNHLSKCHNINAQSKIDENTKENITHKAIIRQLENKEDVTDASTYQIVPDSKIEENEEGKWRFHQVNAYSTPDENTEENKMDRGMKELIIKEDIIDISFHQTILYSKIEENKENNWSSTNSSYINFHGQILITEGDKVYTAL